MTPELVVAGGTAILAIVALVQTGLKLVAYRRRQKRRNPKHRSEETEGETQA